MTEQNSKIDVVMITTGKRPELLQQSLLSMHLNTVVNERYSLTVVVDGGVGFDFHRLNPLTFYDTLIVNQHAVGASASRNIGSSSIPKYRRGSHVCFFDDDVYACPGWDRTLLSLSKALPGALVSGHGHPYNHGDLGGEDLPPHTKPLVISTVNFFMPWSMWDHVGWFTEPGGAGGSEDHDWCCRASRLGYGFAVSEPQVILHCGLTSSTGKKIVGYEEMVKQNEWLIAEHGIKGVIWQ